MKLKIAKSRISLDSTGRLHHHLAILDSIDAWYRDRLSRIDFSILQPIA